MWCFVRVRESRWNGPPRSEKHRKWRRFGLPNRAWERPGDPKSSSGGHVRAKKRARGASRASDFFFVGSNERLRARKCAAGAGKERGGPKTPRTNFGIFEWIAIFFLQNSVTSSYSRLKDGNSRPTTEISAQSYDRTEPN